MKRIWLLPALCVYACSQLFAQQVTGVVIDENNQPLEFANVVYLSLPDSTFVTGAVTDQTGRFTMPYDGKQGLIRITSVGYTLQLLSVKNGYGHYPHAIRCADAGRSSD